MPYILLAVSAVLTGIDQILKLWAVENLKGQPYRRFIAFGDTEILNLTYLENDGAVFGAFSDMKFILIGVVSLLLAGCIWFLLKREIKSRIFDIALTLVIAGGLGNLIDRIFRGGLVVDYLDFGFFDFAVFNFADICVTMGTAIAVFYLLFLDKEKAEKNSAAPPEVTEDA